MSRAGGGVVVGWDEKQGAAFMGCRDHGHKCQLLILRGADLASLERSGLWGCSVWLLRDAGGGRNYPEHPTALPDPLSLWPCCDSHRIMESWNSRLAWVGKGP